MDIVRTGAPAQFKKLGYFEGFNLGRECLNMDATQVDPSLTHVHFAFGLISNQFEIYQENEYAEFQFQQFKNIKGPKRIISFGGWVFSAEAPNFPILRNAVSSATTRETVATNLVKYVVDNGLDGLDIDWEYPSVSWQSFHTSARLETNLNPFTRRPTYPISPLETSQKPQTIYASLR